MGFIFALGTAAILYNHEQNRVEHAFQEEIMQASAYFTGKIEVNERVLLSVVSYFNSRSDVTMDEFRIFVSPILKSYRFIQAIEWIPKVTHKERSKFESHMTDLGHSGFKFKEKIDGVMKQSRDKGFYFPVYYVEPMSANIKAHGFDLASNKTRLLSLEQSRDEALTVATAKITLVQEKESQAGFLIFAPIYGRENTPKDIFTRRTSIKGFALGVYRVGDMMTELIAPYLKKGMAVEIYDSDIQNENLLFRQEIKNSVMSHVQNFNLSRRIWKIRWQADASFAGGVDFAQPISGFIVVLSLTFLTSFFIRSNMTQTRHIAEEVKAKTKEANDARIEAENANLAKGKFLANMSHEIRTPLNAINGFANILLEQNTDKNNEEFIQGIQESGKNLLTLINEVLDFSKIEAGKIELEISPLISYIA